MHEVRPLSTETMSVNNTSGRVFQQPRRRRRRRRKLR